MRSGSLTRVEARAFAGEVPIDVTQLVVPVLVEFRRPVPAAYSRKSRPVAIIKVPRFWWGAWRTGGAHPASADGLAAFAAEGTSADVASPTPGGLSPRNRRLLQWAVVILSIAGAAGAGIWQYQRHVLASPSLSQLTLETTPGDLDVTIGGTLRGRTPLTLDLAPGAYEIVLGIGERQRTVNVTLTPGMTLVQRVDFEPVEVTPTGALRVDTEPSGLPVTVDGAQKGSSPVAIAGLAPGDHEVVVGAGATAVRRTVSVEPGETLSLVISAVERPAGSAGWVSVTSPVALQFRQAGRIVGSTDLDRVMLPVGEHTLELVNEALGYRAQRRVTIAPGRTVNLVIQVPQGTLSINAQPWAEVSIGGRSLGQTPLGNVGVAIGTHEVVFRHPDLGERRETVTVTLQQPARIGVDMRRR